MLWAQSRIGSFNFFNGFSKRRNKMSVDYTVKPNGEITFKSKATFFFKDSNLRLLSIQEIFVSAT